MEWLTISLYILHYKSRYFKSYSWTKTDTLSPVTKQSAESATDQKSEMEEQAKSRLNAGSGSLIVEQQPPILKQGRRGIKRPDITVQENDKKRPRKRKRWWSGCKQFVDFLFMKKHESNIISQFWIF